MHKLNIDNYCECQDIEAAFRRKIKAAVMFGYIKALTGREIDGKVYSRNDAIRQFFDDGGMSEDYTTLESLYVLGTRLETKHNKET